MKTIRHIFTLLLVAVFCQGAYAQSFSSKHVKVDYAEARASHNQKKNFTYKNLRLYPIRASKTFLKDGKSIGKYTSLRTALKLKKVTITEQSAPTTVATTTTRTNNNSTTMPITRINQRQVQTRQVLQQRISPNGI